MKRCSFFFAAAIFAAFATFAQTGGTGGPPPTSGGTITAPPAPENGADAGMTEDKRQRASPDTVRPKTGQTESSVRAQAEAKRRFALEQCQPLTGPSRTDCVRRADEEFKRATSQDALSWRDGREMA